MTAEPPISVILPVYGSYNRLEELALVARCWRAQTVNPEIIISYQGEQMTKELRAIAQDVDATIVVESPMQGENGPWYSPGRLRNTGLRAASTTHVYISDADIIPYGPAYLEEGLSLLASRGGALIKPLMHRLRQEDIPTLLRSHDPTQGIITSGGETACLRRLDAGCLAPLQPPEVVIFLRDGRYVCTLPEYRLLMANAGQTELLEEFLVKPEIHWGAVLTTCTTLEEVGSYCESYSGWGCEDDDLHVKLDHYVGCHPLRLEGKRGLVHLEHSRGGLSKSYAENSSILNRRCSMGAAKMIEDDIRQWRQRG